MLQIITGKFYGDGEKQHNACNGILYSNVFFHAISPINYGKIQINTVDWSPGLPSYVISYDNCIERVPQTEILIKVGDNVIIEQLKYILSFSLNAIFDENETMVEELCRYGNIGEHCISSYVDKTFEKNRHLTGQDWEQSMLFYNKMMGLSRKEYKVVMRCLAAYHSSFKVFNNDISLAYSILVYVLETLSANFDEYSSSWEDYDQETRIKLDKKFEKIDPSVADEIRTILISKEHLRLARRFSAFVLEYIDQNYYLATDKRQATEDELYQAVAKAYVFRSKYTHELQPILKQLYNVQMSKNSEIFEWQHEVFFTYAGLLRLTRTVITNFVNSRCAVEKESYEWYDDLPGIVKVELHPKLWLGKSSDPKFKCIFRNFGALLFCMENEKEVPNLNSLVENYLHNILSICKKDRCMAYVLCWIYINCASGNEATYTDNMKELLNKNHNMTQICSIATIIGRQYGMPTDDYSLEDVIETVNTYNKSKFKNNRLKMPASLENKIYINIAESFGEERISDKLLWYEKTYKNAVNDDKLQEIILKKIRNIREGD